MTGFRAAPDLEKRLKDSPEMRAAINSVTGEVYRAALRRASAHVDTGNYVRNLRPEPPDENCVGRVVANAPYSNWVEYGTGSRRSELAPTPCPHEPQETGIHPQFIMLGAILDVTK